MHLIFQKWYNLIRYNTFCLILNCLIFGGYYRDTQPDFSKRIIFNQDILIKEGEEYICSIWENTDGSINFGLKLLSEIKNTEKFDKESEPKSIGEIINKIIN
jgi:hypothetical protein